MDNVHDMNAVVVDMKVALLRKAWVNSDFAENSSVRISTIGCKSLLANKLSCLSTKPVDKPVGFI